VRHCGADLSKGTAKGRRVAFRALAIQPIYWYFEIVNQWGFRIGPCQRRARVRLHCRQAPTIHPAIKRLGMARPRKTDPRRETGAASEAQALPGAVTRTIDPGLPKTAQVYGILRRAIVNLHLAPGSSVNEKAICDQLGISRTPLREAILQLQAENLVTVLPNAGTYVSRIDLQSVFDGQLVRDALELKVVRLAATRMTPQFERALDFNIHQQKRMAADLDYDGFYDLDEAFHTMICAFGASAHIWKIVNGAKAQLDRVRRLSFPLPSHLELVLSEHVAVVDGLKLRDPDVAAQAMKVHIDRVFTMIRRHIVERRDYFAADAGEVLDGYETGR
jgi:DNA-binding GntR family transcriptional regulator